MSCSASRMLVLIWSPHIDLLNIGLLGRHRTPTIKDCGSCSHPPYYYTVFVKPKLSWVADRDAPGQISTEGLKPPPDPLGVFRKKE
jgi:hypothetical protein